MTQRASHEKVGDCEKKARLVVQFQKGVRMQMTTVACLEVMRWHFDLELVSKK